MDGLGIGIGFTLALSALGAVRELSTDIAGMSKAQLEAVEGIGASTAEKLREFVETGTITRVDALRTNMDTRIVISADGKYEQLAYQSDNEFTIEINPAPETADAESSLFSETKEYEGQRLTLNFQDIETRAVLQLLAETSGRNIVVSDTVQGNVTLRLRNVPWDQALDIVMTTKGLDMRENGNVIIVAPAEEIAHGAGCQNTCHTGDLANTQNPPHLGLGWVDNCQRCHYEPFVLAGQCLAAAFHHRHLEPGVAPRSDPAMPGGGKSGSRAR